MQRPRLLPSRRAFALAPALLACTATLAAFAVAVPSALAQEAADRPGPAAAEPAAPDGARQPASGNGAPGRRASSDELVPLGFNDVSIDEVFDFIAEETGKVVIPLNLVTLKTKKITLLSDELVARSRALDLVIGAFNLNGVGVIEREDVMIIGDVADIAAIRRQPVLDKDVDITNRTDQGTLVVKVFLVENVPAEELLDLITETQIPDYASITADPNSNQVIVYGDIALCQHVQLLIDQLDNQYVQATTQTFRLAHADATLVEENILALFEEDGNTAGNAGGARGRAAQLRGRGRGEQSPTSDTVGPQIALKTAVNVQQNSVTVAGDPKVVQDISRLIAEEWDLPRSPGTSRIYDLQFVDPVVVADRLNSLLGQGTGGGGGGRGSVRGGGQAGGDVQDVLSGIYQIEAYPDTGQLLIFSKTEESLEFLDTIIKNLDQPTRIGLPFVVELKHANAIDLAEQLNALLAEAGSGATIARPETGLSGANLEDVSTGGGNTDEGTAGNLDFPWQRGGRQDDERSEPSPLIGKVRIVPIARQNALAILAPRPQEEAVRQLIDFFDRPGRQVMLEVVIAELELNDDFAFGLRWSSDQGIANSANPDNQFIAGFGLQGETDDPFNTGLFDTSILNTNISLNLVLQALAQKTNLRINQQPVVFTADNQEAIFFDGQEIPFITQTTINSQGNPTDSFEYRNVGVLLNARPRITARGDVDVTLRLEISATVPGQTLFGGAIIDKRLTTTNVVVKNNQTIVLSGILREQESTVTRKVPLLGDIPLLGELFTSRENSTIRSELVAFITPRVVESADENDENFQEDFRQRLEQLMLPVREQIDMLESDPEAMTRRMRPSRRTPADEQREGDLERRSEEGEDPHDDGAGDEEVLELPESPPPTVDIDDLEPSGG